MISGKKKKVLESAVAALLCLTVALVIFGFAQNRRVDALTLQVNAAYQKAFFETIELLAGAQLNMEKLLATSSRSQQQALLVSVGRQAEGAQDNLAAMPSSNEDIAGALKFVNQLGDYTRVLAESLGSGQELSEEDFNQLSILHAHCSQLSAHLAELSGQFERGELVFSADDVANSAVTLTEQVEPAVDYPVLLYDGPFSDASQTTEMKALGAKVYTQEEAEAALVRFLGEDRIKTVHYTGESSIPVECFEFTALTEEGVLDAGVTRRGGKVLYVLPESGETQVALSQAECIDLAHAFLAKNGFGDMQVSYWRQMEGILTVNFAAVQDGVLLYPDLVKVQVSMRTGRVIGIESGNYLRNHTVRDFPPVQITFEDALRRISDSLSVSKTRLTLIPLGNTEALCWEATAYRNNGDQYLVYIDAYSGKENMILRVTQDDQGYITQ